MTKVLSIDDSSTLRKIIGGTVSRLGFEFLEAEHGQAALDKLEGEYQNVSLILLDWNMPVMDGIQTLEALKADTRYKNIPVIMVTTESEKTNVVKAIQTGAKNYLTKPFNQEELATRILECLGMEVRY